MSQFLQITDLKRQYLTLQDEMLPAIQKVLASGYFIKGPELAQCEETIAKYNGVKFGIGVNSGTDALVLALKAAGIGAGDEVITSAMSFIATAEAISLVGAKPVFVDITCGHDCIIPTQIEDKISSNTKAIIPVHLHGYPCDMDAIMFIAQKHDLYVIEDCAQAIGASYKGRKLGGIGHMGCFSFFPTKNLGCYGDGGMIVTDDESLKANINILREHGSKVKNYQDILGYNSRLDALQAAVLNVKIKYLDQWNLSRRKLAKNYDELLIDMPIKKPPLEISKDTYSVFHHYQIQLDNRDQVLKQMKEAGFECISYYPQPLHLQKLYQVEYEVGDFPNAEQSAKKGLALPLFPELTFEEQKQVVAKLKEILIK